jgi:type I restriction enzyme S subunit
MGYTKQPNQDKALVIGRVGALCGNVHLFTEPVWVTDNALCVDYSKKLSPEYLALYLRVINLNRLANQNTQPLITGTMVKDQPVLIPSFEEQYAIVSEVERRLFTFDDLNDKAVKAIELMQERRTALISAAVTGKIDVRNWQPAQTKIPMEASP